MTISPPGMPYGGSILTIFPAPSIKAVHHTLEPKSMSNFGALQSFLATKRHKKHNKSGYVIICARRGRKRPITSVIGNTLGLKPNQLRRIEKLYTRRIPPDQIVTNEFARQLSELSHETRRQVGALIDRQGHIQYVMVGDNRRIELPDFKRVRVASGRFRGLRCVHTHLRGEPLTQADLIDLALLRLDLMAAIDVDADSGLPGLVRAAHLLPLHSGELDNGTTPELYSFLEPTVA